MGFTWCLGDQEQQFTKHSAIYKTASKQEGIIQNEDVSYAEGKNFWTNLKQLMLCSLRLLSDTVQGFGELL